MAKLRKKLTEYLFVLLTVMIGLSVTATLFMAQRHNVEARLNEHFNIAASDRINVITDAFQNNIAVSRSVVGFFNSSKNVTAQEFQSFASQILHSYPFIEAIEWAPRVEAKNREAFERLGRETVPHYRVKDIGKNGELVDAAARAEYFPIFYIEPVSSYTARVFGVDFMSNPQRRQAIEKAIDTGDTIVTPKVTLLSSHQPGVLFFSPVVIHNEVTGFIAAITPLNPLIAKAIEPLSKEWVNIIAHDITESEKPAEPLFTHASRLQKASDEEIIGIYNSATLRKEVDIEVGGRKWRITVLPANGHFEASHDNSSYIVLIVGILFTGMLAYYMITRLQENLRIRDEVDLRTRELLRTKQEVELILHSTSEGIIGLDENGMIDFSNDMAHGLLGYGLWEMQGQNFHDLLQHSELGGSIKSRMDSFVNQVLRGEKESCNIDSEVFFRKSGEAMEVEYTVSPMMDNGKVAGAVIIFRDITERKNNQLKLEHMASYDHLTGLANRRLFLELLGKALSRADRSGMNVGVIYMDLNDFKPINDTLGHAAGDELLRAFGKRVSAVLRDTDVMARLGGDEFAIIADNPGARSDCDTLIKRLNHSLKEKFLLGETDVTVTASIGIATYPDQAGTLDDLIAAADSAMYEAKKGKNR